MFIIIMWPAFFARVRPGDEEREADLHEQHEEAGQQHPGEVDRDAEVPGLGRERVQAGLRDGHAVAGRPGGAEIVRQSAGGGAGRVATVMAPHGTGDHQRKERERAHEDHLLRCRHRAPGSPPAHRPLNRNEARVDCRLSRWGSEPAFCCGRVTTRSHGDDGRPGMLRPAAGAAKTPLRYPSGR